MSASNAILNAVPRHDVIAFRAGTLRLCPTPKAIHTFNNSHAKKIGLFHVTC